MAEEVTTDNHGRTIRRSKIKRYAMLSIAFEIFHYFFTLAGLNPALPALHLLILDLILYFNFPFTIYLLLRAIFEKRPEGSMGDVIFSSIAVGTNIAYWLTIGYAMQTVWA